MAIEETFRRELQTRVADVLDEESARFLMAHLPPVPWPEVATKHDLEVLRAGMDARFDQAKVTIDGRFATLETSIDGRFEVMDERMEHMSSKLQTALADQRADLSLLISNQTRTMIIALITAFVAISSLALFR